MSTQINRGDTYERGGVRVIVHSVEGGEVYFHSCRLERLNDPRVLGLGWGRMPLDKFTQAVSDAERVTEATR